MFHDAIRFNQPFGGWNVSKVQRMDCMFEGAAAFDQPIGGWDVSEFENMHTCSKVVLLTKLINSAERCKNMIVFWIYWEETQSSSDWKHAHM